MTLSCSAVIPTLNEAPWLPRVLGSLRSATEMDEIIVADAGSQDSTVEIARSYGCRIVAGGSPARGRNVGAALSTAETILFADADVVVPKSAIVAGLKALQEPAVAAVFFQLRPISHSLVDRALYGIANAYLRLLARARRSQGFGSCILVRRNLFFAIGGFDENIAVSEDLELATRLRRVGRTVLARGAWVWVSARRLRMENNWVFAGKCVLWAALRLCGTSLSLVGYRWMRYPAAIAVAESLFPDLPITLKSEGNL